MTVSSEISPPHDLQLVIEFINTLDFETGEDELGTPAQLTEWMREAGLLGADEPAPEPSAAAETLELREALRAILHAHTHRTADGTAGRLLEQVADRGRLSVCFEPDGSIRVAPRAAGYPGALARLLVPVARAAMDGTWARLKACDADDCQFAFYDRSRNHSGRWCDMALCGNRTKVRTYRTKRSG
jgi:predicted RNA-binding Zn ribbon-like protein